MTQECETCHRQIPVSPPNEDQVLRVTCRGPGGVADGRMHDFQYRTVPKRIIPLCPNY